MAQENDPAPIYRHTRVESYIGTSEHDSAPIYMWHTPKNDPAPKRMITAT